MQQQPALEVLPRGRQPRTVFRDADRVPLDRVGGGADDPGVIGGEVALDAPRDFHSGTDHSTGPTSVARPRFADSGS
ncbi:hypothetical protein QRX60_14835 [Amycolatopsis mongoliensis]|uniref:Uncharacterized protein n=1 Tax=Amycolatopsis mongoliensis TaxID=715475 RepID=A0A9Y2JWR7_9PSEU|nr:hypothetical protein [Amycolatopsis sp. 4-36]WIY05046.1 hypothetical protein QRX60_14835 [Amycolatopsis sp. 4-36]